MKYAKKTNKQRLKVHQRLLEISDFGQNYHNYRQFIQTPHHPRILFLGAYQKDLIYVQEQFPNKIDGLINVKKCDECIKLLEAVSGCQNEKFLYKEVKEIQNLIRNIPNPPESTELMKLSIQTEKKKK